MILNDFIYLDEKGIYCPYGDFYLDPKEPVTLAIISHAHGDHAVSGNNEVYCTEATTAFMQSRYGKTAAKVFNIVGWKSAFKIKDINISFLPAGHMLGSAMILMEYHGIKYLYTGDFKLQPDATCEPIAFCKAEVLITESTFADPNISHPNPTAEIDKLNSIKTNILLGAYGLGKSQRLISLINQHAPQKNLLIHHKIMPLNSIYEKLGYPLGKYQLYGRKLMKSLGEFVYIVPPFTFNSYIKAIGVKRLFASGWKSLQASVNDTLYISDHADWNDILETVKQVEPQQIWTLHGDGTHLKKYYENDIFVKKLN